MPATFDAFGLHFLYPDNWNVADRPEEDGEQGVTLELPGGGFLTIEVVDPTMDEDELIDQVHQALIEEYTTVEKTELTPPPAVVLERVSPLDAVGESPVGQDITSSTGEKIVEFQFYFLDLLVTSRVIVMPVNQRRLLIQIQAENRDFDKDTQVFEAVLTQIRGGAS